MLLPALNKAREKSQGTSCLNNIKQLLLANNQYAGDYSVLCPVTVEDTSFYGGRHGEHGSYVFNLTSGGFLHHYLGNGSTVTICPTWEKMGRITDLTASSAAGGIGYNRLKWNSNIDLTDLSISNGRTKPERIKRPSEITMFGDAAVGATPSAASFLCAKGAGGPAGNGSVHFRHGNLANIGWVDGHASTVSFQGGNSVVMTGYFDDTLKHFDPDYESGSTAP
jgi:prepilin-type processing-associated H-X9-DG protein